MMTRRFSAFLCSLVLLLGVTMLPAHAQGNYNGTGPYTIEFTHQGLDGATYRSRFTIEGAVGIQPTGQGTGTDYAYLAGYADPNGTITVTMEWIECSDGGDLQWKEVDVWMGNRYTNGDMQREANGQAQQFTQTSQTKGHSLDKVVYTFDCKDYLQADPSAQKPMLLVNASTDVQVGYSVSEVVVNLNLKLDPDAAGGDSLHVKEDHNASDTKGIKKYLIPGAIGGVLLGGGAAAASAMKGKRKDEEEGEGGDEGDEGEGEGEENEPDVLEMEIYKDFGDTLFVGDAADSVFASIVRHTADGRQEWTDEALTQRIQITSVDGYLYVQEHGMEDGWKAAYVAAPECEEGEPPQESIVSFTIASAEASYTNHLHFKIRKPEVIFEQENLTLPARYEKKVELPFLIVGMNDGTAIITATIEDDDGKPSPEYTIETVWNEKKKHYFAIIKDTVLDPKVDEGIPGNYLGYHIRIEAQNKNGLKAKGELPLFRYYMGLVMRMRSNVHCHLEEYNPMRHESGYLTKLPDGKEYVPAQQDCYLKLYDYNEEKHELYVIDPKLETVKWTVKDLADQKVLKDIIGNEAMQVGLDMTLAGAGLGAIGSLVSQAHSQVHAQVISEHQVAQQRLIELQQQLDKLGLTFSPRWQTSGEGHIYYMLCCSKGVLNAPNRFDAEMEVVASYKGKSYSFKRTLHMLSQPFRESANPAEKLAALKRDDAIRERLEEIEGGIQAAGVNDRLAPLLYFIRLQLDFYHEDYGFDERNFKAIQETYQSILQNEAAEARVKSDEATAADNLKWYTLDWWLQRSYEGHEYLENMHWAGRIGFAVASFGFSEIVYSVPYEMKKYVDEGGDSTLVAFTVGAKEAVEAYAIEALITLGLGGVAAVGKGAAAGAKTLGKGTVQATKNVLKGSLKSGGRVAKEAMKDSVKDLGVTLWNEGCTGLKSWAKKQISWEVGAAEKAIASKVKGLLAGSKSLASGSKYAVAEAFAKQQAIENLENMQAIMDLCRWKPTVENLRMRQQLFMHCQADKQTMMLLKNSKLVAGEKLLEGVDFNTMRGLFNRSLQKINEEVDKAVIADLAIAGKISPDMIKIVRATSSNADDLAKGLTVTFDRDVTYYYVLNGKEHYFNQAFVEKLYAKHFRNAVNSRTLNPSALHFDPSKLTPEALKRLEVLEAKQASIATRLYDHTVVEDVLRHLESYGEDLQRMINPEFYGEALKNPAKVAEAVLHKGTSRFDYADALWSQAEAAGDIVQKQLLQGQAVSETMEGCRQMVKVFDIIKARDAVRNTFTKIPDNLKEAVEVLRHLNGVTTTLSQAEAALSQLGFTFRSFSQAVSETVVRVG